MWASIAIALMSLLVILCCCGCLCKLCWKKRKDRGFRKGLKSAVDFRSVQILGSTLKDKARTDVKRMIFCSTEMPAGRVDPRVIDGRAKILINYGLSLIHI